jgi:regulator of protease activity HflC (stomatin/prohibitin superfamily)
MCVHAAALTLAATGCASVTIQPGHRGVLVDPDALPRPTVLVPGIHRVSSRQSVTDYMVTYARRDIRVEVLARDGTPIHVDLIVVFRPIVAELAQLHVDEGPRYFDDVVAPALTSTARVRAVRGAARGVGAAPVGAPRGVARRRRARGCGP